MSRFSDLDFVAIDFETAVKHHICAVGIVNVKAGEIVDEFYSLIQPPGNFYNFYNVQVHGITPDMTESEALFDSVYSEIKKRIKGNIVVAHNESFDRNVLMKTMNDFGISYSDLDICKKWECTMRIYKKKGFTPASLDACSRKFNISLQHHNALSDAIACAKLYLLHMQNSE
ncbi:MAG: 3'-5' exonuclease [Bacteroidales bacterium]|nr:3'-5' exonuclease [Bacteroidales bacterium]